jgi:outer membrane murein-binding lipoprotein Lpp
MRKAAIFTILGLCLAVVVVVGLLARSSSRAASLEERITTLESERTNLQGKVEAARREAVAVKERLRPVRFKQELVVAPNGIENFQFTPTAASGTLSGTWRSSGRGFGGADDTIFAFRLTDARDGIVEETRQGGPLPSSGKFFVKVTEKGTYTFFFDNKGIFRTTPRRVFVEGEFKPD